MRCALLDRRGKLWGIKDISQFPEPIVNLPVIPDFSAPDTTFELTSEYVRFERNIGMTLHRNGEKLPVYQEVQP